MITDTETLNDSHLSQYLPATYRGLVIENSNIDGMYDFLNERLENTEPFFRRIRVSFITYELTCKGIRLALMERPDVLIIDNLDRIDVARAIYDNAHLFRQHDYLLEISNTQYCLVRRDCYK